jgi:hypothetical protein
LGPDLPFATSLLHAARTVASGRSGVAAAPRAAVIVTTAIAAVVVAVIPIVVGVVVVSVGLVVIGGAEIGRWPLIGWR